MLMEVFHLSATPEMVPTQQIGHQIWMELSRHIAMLYCLGLSDRLPFNHVNLNISVVTEMKSWIENLENPSHTCAGFTEVFRASCFVFITSITYAVIISNKVFTCWVASTRLNKTSINIWIWKSEKKH